MPAGLTEDFKFLRGKPLAQSSDKVENCRVFLNGYT